VVQHPHCCGAVEHAVREGQGRGVRAHRRSRRVRDISGSIHNHSGYAQSSEQFRQAAVAASDVEHAPIAERGETVCDIVMHVGPGDVASCGELVRGEPARVLVVIGGQPGHPPSVPAM